MDIYLFQSLISCKLQQGVQVVDMAVDTAVGQKAKQMESFIILLRMVNCV
ncbi:Uncharacterised protein [Mycobacteroides abscessus subsp. abscessus]|nr:Uncharacterised protein [Mycobacteroides abscessus subsp. abscessus]